MPYRVLEIERRGAVEYVTLNRPDIRNAINDQVVAELTDWARAAAAASDVRVVVLSGRGKVFSAGADVTWLRGTLDYAREEYRRDGLALATMLQTLDRLPQALIGRVHGAAIAGGSGLIATCDIVVASEETVFGFTETRLGIVPALISPFVISKIGVSAARELFLTGMRFGAARAREIGLVHAVCPLERLDETVDRYIHELLEAGPQAVTTAKRLIREVAWREAESVMELTADVNVDRRTSDEGRAGMTAFLEKRSPPWTS